MAFQSFALFSALDSPYTLLVFVLAIFAFWGFGLWAYPHRLSRGWFRDGLSPAQVRSMGWALAWVFSASCWAAAPGVGLTWLIPAWAIAAFVGRRAGRGRWKTLCLWALLGLILDIIGHLFIPGEASLS